MSLFNKTPYIIAEIGANHNGSIELAKNLIHKAKEAGADCVKFQVKMDPFELSTHEHSLNLNDGKVELENVDKWDSKEEGLSDIFDQMKKYHLSKDEYKVLFDYAKKIGIDVTASVFTPEGVEYLKSLDVKFVKLASMDINNFNLQQAVFRTELPLIISSGMADESEIEEFAKNIPDGYESKVYLLHCVSIYPPNPEILNLSFIKTLMKKYNFGIGYSDHTIGIIYPLISISMGASVIEKHFTLDKNLPGWDHKVSADFEELKSICDLAADVKKSVGNGVKQLCVSELNKRLKFRRSLIYSTDLSEGHILQRDDIVYKRPGTGISVKNFERVIGKKLKKNVKGDTLLKWTDLG